MASSSKKPARGRGGSSSGKGGSSTAGGARTPRGSEDNGSSSDSILGSPEPHGDILGQPTVDPWYRSGERFPSVPASLQPPPPDWEWLVIREDSAADVAWTPNFREIRDLQIQRNEMLAVPLVFDFQCWCAPLYSYFKMLKYVPGYRSITAAGPADLVLSPEELEIESALADYIGRKNIALGTQAARFKPWMEHFNRETDPLIRKATFVAYWLSKCIFGEHPAYSIKPLYFPLAVKVVAGVCFPLAPLLLGQIYTQLDLLHAEELAGASCHLGRKPYEARNKFASMPEGVVANVGDFQGDVPAVYRWVGSKFYDHSLIPSLDSESKVCWRPYGVTHRGFVYESVMSGFSHVEAQDYTLIAGDMASLAYLSATNAGWLPVLSSDGFQFTVYSAHRVRKQFGFDQEIPAVMGIAAGEIPIINPFLRDRAFAYWSSIAPRVIIPSGDRIGVYTTSMSNYWRGLMAAMVEFRNNGREDISHLLESYTSLLPHPRLFVATNTMTTYANRQSLGYAVWNYENSQWVIHGSPHPPLWLRDHPHVAAPGKVPSSRGRRTASAGISAVKRKQPDRSKKGEAASKDSPVQASKKKKTSATKGSKEVLTLKTAIASPPLVGEDIPQGVSAPVSKKPMKKTRAGKRTFVPPAFPSAPSSIAARVAARKSSRGVVYSEKRSKQRADASSRIPIEIPDDLDSSSSSSDPSGAAAKEIEGEDAKVGAAETVSGVDTEDDGVSMDELEATKASSESTSVAFASKPISAKEAVEEHATIGVVTGVERVVETIPVAVTSSGGTVQGGPSGSGSHVDPSLLDSSPSTRQYVQRARRGSIVSTDSERTGSATIRVSTPPSPFPESGGTAPTPITIAAEASAVATIQECEVVPTAIEEIPVGEGGIAHVSDILEGNNSVESIPIDENLVINTDFDAGIAQTEHAEVAASGEPVQADVIPDSNVPVMEEELAQGPVDDVDMADAHDSYDEVLAEAEDNMAGAQATDIEVTAPVTAHASSTKTAVDSAIRGQPGLLSAARPATSRTSVLADMEAFFREFDRTSFSSRHAEHFWIFDNAKADFEIFRAPQGGIRFLKALWEKCGSCSSYFRLGVYVESSMLTLLCCVLAHMEHTRLEDITEVHILEWKAVVQEAIEGGFRFGFILDYLRRLAHGMFSRRVLAELREAEARVTALRDALNIVAPNPWDLASARRASAESGDGSAFHDLLA
uniref:Aminotransferase-like plant mobile domain-containing protein n=1 Tax=Fagus sylvatica TaxID=28930 RepID=A0A2N9GXU8_FAGSY